MPKKPPTKKHATPMLMPSQIYRCSACGKEYVQQDNNFAYCISPYYEGNNNRLTICNACLETFVDRYTTLLGSEEEAMHRLCMHLDIFFDESAMKKTLKNGNGRSRVREYVRIQNLKPNQGKTYDDYLASQLTGEITSMEDFERVRDSDKASVTLSDEQLERWGLGFAPEEYELLDAHLASLEAQRSGNDAMQDIYIRDLCEIKVLQARALKNGDMDAWTRYKKLYQTTAKSANLNPKKNDNGGLSEDTWGKFIANIEQYTPAEYYKDRKMFKDADGIGAYFERIILRPLRNLLLGTNERDPEYDVSGDGGDDG